jgi:general secretion pathway protein B
MSFILDALKKSESDRQRQSGPSLFEVKVAPPRRRLPLWAVAIAVLLGINIIVISWMLLRHGPAQAPAPVHTATSASAPVAVDRPRAMGPARESAPAVPIAAASNPAAPLAAPPEAAQVAAPVPGAGQAAAAAAPSTGAGGGTVQAAPSANAGDYGAAAEPPPGTGGGGSVTAGDALPLYQQVVARDGLPPLHLDLHVYAENPKDRFVMINMHKLVEGGTLPDGVHVEAIRPDGVVLSFHGSQFLLPRD